MRRYKLLIFLAVLAALGAAVSFGYPTYKDWKQHRLVEQAERFRDQGEYSKAMLSLRQALSQNPSNAKACAMIAHMADQFRSPYALEWYQRLAELEPQVVNHKYDLAVAAIHLHDFSIAAQALESVSPDQRKTADFQEAAGLLALATNSFGQAETHLREAIQLNPTNQNFQLNLAIVQLNARDPNRVRQARQKLDDFRVKPGFKAAALHALIADAQRQHDAARALELSEQVVDDPAATFEDRIIHLSLLAQAKQPGQEDYFKKLQSEAAKNPGDVFALSGWLVAHGRADESLAWLKGLPADLQQEPPVPMALADCYLATKDWKQLPELLKDRDWGQMEFLRQAVLARALHDDKEEEARRHWHNALEVSDGRFEALSSLARLAGAWGWDKERVQVWWLLAARYPQERRPLQTLYQYYVAQRDTAGLQKVFARKVELNQNDLEAKNNLAATSLLLSSNLKRAFSLAQEVYEKQPTNAIFASTYGYALHVEDRTLEALKVFRKLSDSDLTSPNVAAYYGVVLTASGDFDAARKYLDIANQANLLPEERALVVEAKKLL